MKILKYIKFFCLEAIIRLFYELGYKIFYSYVYEFVLYRLLRPLIRQSDIFKCYNVFQNIILPNEKV